MIPGTETFPGETRHTHIMPNPCNESLQNHNWKPHQINRLRKTAPGTTTPARGWNHFCRNAYILFIPISHCVLGKRTGLAGCNPPKPTFLLVRVRKPRIDMTEHTADFYQEEYDDYMRDTPLVARFDPATIQMLVADAVPKHAAYEMMFDEYLKQRSRFYEYDESEK